MKTKIFGLFVCVVLITTILPVSGTINVDVNATSTNNDGTLSGYVNDTSMNTIEGALVRVYFHGTFEEDYTDSTGYYHVTNIPICYCMKNCTASKPGYKSEKILLAIVEDTTHDFKLSYGNILFVGGSGPGNYTKIQSALDDANQGDTVFVYDDSAPYYENLLINKSINLIGENKESTIINGSGDKIVVNISSDNVVLSGFTIQDYKNHSLNDTSKISIQSDYNVISGNIIMGNIWCGIEIIESENNIISDNAITCSNGIVFIFGSNNNISGNTIKDCNSGIDLGFYSNNNSIFGNNLINNTFGITTGGFAINGIISQNNIKSSFYGIIAVNCFNYKITKNNFIGNFVSARFAYVLIGAFGFGFENKVLREIHSTIKWEGNYWNKPRSFPKPILGRLPPSGYIPWINFDKNPAQEPYDI